MGEIAELLEKKALDTITEDEQKKLDQLLAEAKLATSKKKDSEEEAKDDKIEDTDDAVDAAAQKMADAVQSRVEEGLKKVMDSLKPIAPRIETGESAKYIVDAKLGKKTIDELGDMKIKLGDRAKAGKKVTEISQRSVEFLKAFFQGDKQKLQILSGGTAADGGYLVPEEFANVIVEDIRDLNIMRQLASVMTTTTDTVHIPSLISRPHAAWRAEKAVKSTSTATFTENVLTPYSLASIVPLTNELVADASLGVGGSIVNWIAGIMAVSLNEEEEKAFWVGSGTGRPTGVDGGAYTLRTTAAGAGASDSTRADSIISAYQNTPQGYRNRAVWVMNMGTLGEVGRLKDSQNRYLLTDLAGSPTQTLKGRPVYESNYLAGGTALFGDFSFYQIVDREGISVAISNEATVAGSSAFEKNLTFVRVEKRVDAELLLPAAVSKVTGLGTP